MCSGISVVRIWARWVSLVRRVQDKDATATLDSLTTNAGGTTAINAGHHQYGNRGISASKLPDEGNSIELVRAV